MINFLKILLFMSCLTVVAHSGYAQSFSTLEQKLDKKYEYGVKMHTMIPNKLIGVNQFGEDVSLDTLSGKNGVVLYFVRSADWCPYCKEQLIDLSRRGSTLQDYGYNIVIVSYDPVSKLKRFTEQYDFPYTMIADRESKIIKDFGLFNGLYPEGTAFHGVSRPAIYVIGYDGYIINKFFDEDFKVRLYIEDVEKMLQAAGDYTPVESPLSNNLNP